MISFRALLTAAALSASVALPLSASADSDRASGLSSSERWLTHYYQNPQPADLARAVMSLSREGYFDVPGNVSRSIGFFSAVFAQHPEYVSTWFTQFEKLPVRAQRLMASALWYSGHPQGEKILDQLAMNASPETRASIDRLLSQNATPVLHTPVLSESSMNLQWGSFLASGDERYVTNILSAVGAGLPGVNEAARMSLAMNAASHPRVMEICRAQLDKQPNEVRSVLRAALNEAEARRPGSI